MARAPHAQYVLLLTVSSSGCFLSGYALEGRGLGPDANTEESTSAGLDASFDDTQAIEAEESTEIITPKREGGADTTCSDARCELLCKDPVCTAACTSEGECHKQCAQSERCATECPTGASCFIDCEDTLSCEITCQTGSRCDVACRSGGPCNVDCAPDAMCSIRCFGPSVACNIDQCASGTRLCNPTGSPPGKLCGNATPAWCLSAIND